MYSPEKYYKKLRKIYFAAIVFIPFAVLLLIFDITGISDKILKECSILFGFDEFSQKADDYPLSVHFIDVGSGDSILICCEDKIIMIDTGSSTINGKSKQYLKHKGIEKIDIFIATHMDSDHIGDFPSIAENFYIGEVWLSEKSINLEGEQSQYEKSLFKIIEEKQIKTFYPKSERYQIDKLIIDTFPPIKKYNEENDNSLVVRISYGDISYLLTGDAGKSAEEDIIKSGREIKSDILKLGHHGSKTATSEEFLKAVSPEYAVISAGTDNKYLPNRETVERVNFFGAKILRTDNEGCIIIASDGKNIHILTEFP